MSRNDAVSTAIVGLGRAGWNIHVKALRERKDYRVVAVADPAEERRRQAEEELGAAAFSSIEELLSGSDAELVVVATASAHHVPHSVAALAAGRHVVVEKPMAGNSADGRKALAAAEKSGRVFTVHQSQRWRPQAAYMRKMLHDPRLGHVFFIRMGGYRFSRRSDWQRLAAHDGGTMNNSGVHPLDLCRLLMESRIVDVWGDMQQVLSPGDTEDCAKVIMRGANGRVIDCEVYDACAARLPACVMMGTRGSMTIQSKQAHLRFVKGEMPPLALHEEIFVPGRKYGVIGGEQLEFDEQTEPAEADPGPSFYDLLHKAIREGAPPPVDPAICQEVVEVMEKARAKLTSHV